MMSPIIVVERLYRKFTLGVESITVLEDIDLTIDRGECIVLKGISGSGKTTLLSIMAGLDKPTEGNVIIDSESIAKLPDLHISKFRAKKIGMIFQHFNLLEHLSVWDNVLVPLVPMGIDMDRAREMIESSLALANISHKSDTLASRLSGGEKQRVAIARALVSNPEIILCDEPTANLDLGNSVKFIEILQKLHSLGKTIVVATHDPLFDNLPFESRVIPMANGKIETDI